MTDPCLVICPLGDITHVVIVKDSCGNPICNLTGLYLDFTDCPSEPCPEQLPNWPLVFPDSCNPTTGEHFFNIHASSLDCVDCHIPLILDGVECRQLMARFLDINADHCVFPNDWLPNPNCNDYNCDGTIDATDQTFHAAHVDHCCIQGSEIHGNKWHDLDCDGVFDANEPPVPGWPINLYQGTTLIASTTTNLSGQYWFTGLTAATYRVTETILPGWVQTIRSRFSTLYRCHRPLS